MEVALGDESKLPTSRQLWPSKINIVTADSEQNTLTLFSAAQSMDGKEFGSTTPKSERTAQNTNGVYPLEHVLEVSTKNESAANASIESKEIFPNLLTRRIYMSHPLEHNNEDTTLPMTMSNDSHNEKLNYSTFNSNNMSHIFKKVNKELLSQSIPHNASENTSFGNNNEIPTEFPASIQSKLMSMATESAGSLISNVSAINHLNLKLLEEELAKKESSQQDLLLAIAILQHHEVPMTKTFHTVDWGSDFEGNLRTELMHSNEASQELYTEIEPNSFPIIEFSSKRKNNILDETSMDLNVYKPALPNTMFYENENVRKESGKNESSKVNIDTSIDLPNSVYSSKDIGYLPKNMIVEDFVADNHGPTLHSQYKANLTEDTNYNVLRKRRPINITPNSVDRNNFKWFILVMDGDCGIISKRMNKFVMFLKAALSSRLETQYDDILVMSVFCDNTFMVNISMDSALYSKALSELQALADANTTLLEISGEIFYLEKVLTQNSEGLLSRLNHNSRAADVELVVYIAVGAVCSFILVAVFVVTMISICKQEDGDLTEVKTDFLRSEIPIRKPNVIYSHKFTQELDPSKYRLTQFEEQMNESEDNSGSANLPSDKQDFIKTGKITTCQDRKIFLNQSSSKIQLLEEVQEEDEDDIDDCGVLDGDEDYHDEDDDEDIEDDEDDEFLIESMSRPLQSDSGRTHESVGQESICRDNLSHQQHIPHCCHSGASFKHVEPITKDDLVNKCYDR